VFGKKALLALVAFLLLPSFGHATNLLANGNFESPGQAPWTFGFPPGSPVTVEIISGAECKTPPCLKISLGETSANIAGHARQDITSPLDPSQYYLLSALAKTAPGAKIRVGIYDNDWKNASGKRVGKFLFTDYFGNGNWMRVYHEQQIPLKDDFGETTSGHLWRAYLYAVLPNPNADPVYFDDAVLEFESEPQGQLDLEETLDWKTTCWTFTQTPLNISCNRDARLMDTKTKLTGQSSMRMTTLKTTTNKYTGAISVTSDKPNTLRPHTRYKISVAMRIEDRKCYNYLDYDYPRLWNETYNKNTHGLWCGKIAMNVLDDADKTNNLILTPPLTVAQAYLSSPNVEWFTQDAIIETGLDTTKLSFQIILDGFDGKFYIDSLTVKQIDSVFDYSAALTPVQNSFGGMKIKSTKINPIIVETNAARFIFSEKEIKVEKAGADPATPGGFSAVGKIAFTDTKILANPTLDTSISGVAQINADGAKMAIGADSTLTLELKTPTKVRVSGPKLAYQVFEGGVIFATDYTKGFLFSPMRAKSRIKGMPYNYTDERNVVYDNKRLAELGYNVGTIEQGSYNTADYTVTYDFGKGDGFLAQAFPPKDFDAVKYCKERSEVTNPFQFSDLLNFDNPSTMKPYARDAVKYEAQRITERYSVPIINQISYAKSDASPMMSYRNVSSPQWYVSESFARQYPALVTPVPVWPFDVAGPTDILSENLTRLYADTIHKMGFETIAYISPEFYHTNDIDKIVDNIASLRTRGNLDGIYLDGSVRYDPMRALELARKTRNELGLSGYILQHLSWINIFTLPQSNHFRVPYADVYADAIWAGEDIKLVDDDSWKFNYCGATSNTPTTLLSEARPVDYTKNKTYNQELTLNAQEQWEKSLACNGQFRTALQYPAYINDRVKGYYLPFDPAPYWKELNEKCLPITCGDLVCDVGESIFSCQTDCAPASQRATVTQTAGLYECSAPPSQWIVNGKPLYLMHFTFDGDIISDDADNNLNPWLLGQKEITAPKAEKKDGRGTFYFDGTASVYRPFYGLLEDRNAFTRGGSADYSVFAKVKRDDSAATTPQVILNIANPTRFIFAIKNNKLEATVEESAGNLKTFSSTKPIDSNPNQPEWHTIGFTYSTSGEPTLTIYIDGQEDSRHAVTPPGALAENGVYVLGRRTPDSKNNGFRGWLDDLIVLRWAMPIEQVKEYANNANAKLHLTADVSCIVVEDGKTRTARDSGSTAPPTCGDFVCSAGEDRLSCAADCWPILTYGMYNTPDWISRLPISHIRTNFINFEPATVNAVLTNSKAKRIFVKLPYTPSTFTAQNKADYAAYAALVSQKSAEFPAFYSLSIDDFNTYWDKSGKDAAHLAAIITKAKSVNPNLDFSITVYEDNLEARLFDTIPTATRAKVGTVFLALHFRKNGEKFAQYVQTVKSLFPSAKVFALSYAYDRIDYVGCTGLSTPACTREEETGLFKQVTQTQAQMLADGQLAGIEFYPAGFGNEDKPNILKWGNGAGQLKCNDTPRCIEVTREMRNDAYGTLCEARGDCQDRYGGERPNPTASPGPDAGTADKPGADAGKPPGGDSSTAPRAPATQRATNFISNIVTGIVDWIRSVSGRK
jgi:hypothetical protein